MASAGPREAPKEVPITEARTWLNFHGLLPDPHTPEATIQRRYMALHGVDFGKDVTLQ